MRVCPLAICSEVFAKRCWRATRSMFQYSCAIAATRTGTPWVCGILSANTSTSVSGSLSPAPPKDVHVRPWMASVTPIVQPALGFCNRRPALIRRIRSPLTADDLSPHHWAPQPSRCSSPRGGKGKAPIAQDGPDRATPSHDPNIVYRGLAGRSFGRRRGMEMPSGIVVLP